MFGYAEMFGNKEIFVIGVVLLIGVLWLVSLIFWIWVLIDCLRRETDEGNTRLVWVIVIVFAYIIGAFLYYIIRRPKRKQEPGN